MTEYINIHEILTRQISIVTLTQGILVIAYFPVLSRLWKTKRNGESFLIWTGMLLAPLLSLLSSKGMLATIYSVRAIVCISVLMLLMLRVQYITEKQFVRDQNKPKFVQHSLKRPLL